MLHPGYERGIEPVWFPKEYLSAGESGFAGDYVDPVQKYDGRWVASFAPVAGSEFVVLVQQRYEPVVPRELWLLLILLLAAIVLTLAIKYLLPRSRKPVPA